MTATADLVDGAHPLGPLRNPGAVGGLKDILRHRFLLRLLVKKELRARYHGSPLGLLWSYIKPAVRFAMYLWVIGLFLNHGMTARGLHIFAGMIMVTTFTDSLAKGARSVVKNKALVRKINLPRELFPVSTMTVSLVMMVPLYIIGIGGAFLYGLQPDVRMWKPDLGGIAAGGLAFAIILTWGIGTALLLSALNVYFRDVSNVVEVITTTITWTVPMIYPFAVVSQKLQDAGTWVYELYLASPLCIAVLLNDRFLWVPVNHDQEKAMATELPDHLFTRGLIMLALGMMFVVIGQMVFTRLEGKFAEKL